MKVASEGKDFRITKEVLKGLESVNTDLKKRFRGEKDNFSHGAFTVMRYDSERQEFVYSIPVVGQTCLSSVVWLSYPVHHDA